MGDSALLLLALLWVDVPSGRSSSASFRWSATSSRDLWLRVRVVIIEAILIIVIHVLKVIIVGLGHDLVLEGFSCEVVHSAGDYLLFKIFTDLVIHLEFFLDLLKLFLFEIAILHRVFSGWDWRSEEVEERLCGDP